MRVPQTLLEELIANEGELQSGPINNMGVLRLALDLKEAREELNTICKVVEKRRRKTNKVAN
jgi:hypothetical protein